jgi:lipopolysaccharide transport system permease protein
VQTPFLAQSGNGAYKENFDRNTRSSRGLVMLRSLRPLWLYRGFVLGSVKRDFQSRYRNSLLGAAWAVINPLAMIIVYTVIFSQVMRSRLPEADHPFAYSIYLCSGILTWSYFAEVIVRGQNIFIENANLLKKINFPRVSLPVINVLNTTINFLIGFSLFIVFLLVAGAWPGWAFFAAIPILVVQTLLAIGIGTTLGVLNVFFRDVGQLCNVLIQFWFWFTPVVYPVTILPQPLQNVLSLNPMYAVVVSYHEIFVFGRMPDWNVLIYPSVLAIALCLLGASVFRRHLADMVDEL